MPLIRHPACSFQHIGGLVPEVEPAAEVAGFVAAGFSVASTLWSYADDGPGPRGCPAATAGSRGSWYSARPDDLLEVVNDSGFRPLPITVRHALTAGRLPLLHRDPFDRMLVAQTQGEGMTQATHDAQIQRYQVDVLRV